MTGVSSRIRDDRRTGRSRMRRCPGPAVPPGADRLRRRIGGTGGEGKDPGGTFGEVTGRDGMLADNGPRPHVWGKNDWKGNRLHERRTWHGRGAGRLAPRGNQVAGGSGDMMSTAVIIPGCSRAKLCDGERTAL